MRKAFEHRASKRLTQMFNEARKKKQRPYWVGEHVWERLVQHWSSPEWMKKQEQRKTARKSEVGGMLHTCGSLSIPTHAKKMVCFIYVFLIQLNLLLYIL